MNYHVGVSGFSYPAWKGKFYPDDAKSEDLLALYSRRLQTVEVNSSFYAPPRVEVVENWAAKTSEEFTFSFKAPKQITHVLKLGKTAPDSAEQFSKRLDLLGPRRGPVLFQLPPFMRRDAELLDTFLSSTAGIEPKVFEFRHESWFHERTYQLLDEHGAGFCIAETEDLAPVFQLTGGLAYFRLRKDSYDSAALDEWARKIAETASGSDCYVYMRHDELGENALLAERLAKKLGARAD